MTLIEELRRPETCAAIAARWSRSLGLQTKLEPATFPVAIVGGEPVRAVAHLAGPAGPLSLHLQSQLLAGQLQTLAGLRARPLGPVPLAEAEAGLFAWLALDALPAITAEPLHLLGTTRATRAPAGPNVTWLARIGDRSGLLHWEFASPPSRGRAVPIPTRLTASLPAPRDALVAGAAFSLVLVRFSWTAAGTPLPAVTLTVSAPPLEFVFRVAEGATPSSECPVPTDPDTLPCALTLDLGTLVLPAGVIADLQPGARIPVQLGERPRVWLRAGDVLVAEAELVDLLGEPAVRITRMLLPGGA